MRESTKLAQGTWEKGGKIRRIALTMDEGLFLVLRDLAVADERSISDTVVRLIKRALHK